MTREQALRIVKDRYDLLFSYVDARTGKMMTVIKAESELREIPEVQWPEGGLSLFASDVIELARGDVTIRELVLRKNPEIFQIGRKGGNVTAKRGSDYFRKLQAKRTKFSGGRPRKAR